MISHKNKEEITLDLESIFESILSEFGDAEKEEIQDFLKQTQEKIKIWQHQFEEGNLTLAEVKWLLYSQEEMLSLKTLETKGINTQKTNNIKEILITQILNSFFNPESYDKKNQNIKS